MKTNDATPDRTPLVITGQGAYARALGPDDFLSPPSAGRRPHPRGRRPLFAGVESDLAAVRSVMASAGERPPDDLARIIRLALDDISRRLRDAVDARAEGGSA